ncbi:hypothetical protein G5S52_13250 [Grimontia sp. S25]|uniref:DUF333 domain-containing protein n=1 Tax=Grimontia sedimenti TaxID=2711294 RepID=A0A6M1RE54_9GAMM|nr:hypothetical protein [Grimontia sedimenti]NGN98580.1 hypothetical protein [Grimontia sedimenti]
MKIIFFAVVSALLAFNASAQSGESQGAGLGKNVECVYSGGMTNYVPIGYCKVTGGKH